eukprot:COSAG02_NODE_4580_length_5199_cov_6.923137_6_plen_538_part_00
MGRLRGAMTAVLWAVLCASPLVDGLPQRQEVARRGLHYSATCTGGSACSAVVLSDIDGDAGGFCALAAAVDEPSRSPPPCPPPVRQLNSATPDVPADRAACEAAGACTYNADPETPPDSTCPEINLLLWCGKARRASRGNCALCVSIKDDLAGCTEADTDAFCAKRDPCDGFDCGDHGTCRYESLSEVGHCECRDGWTGDHCEEDGSDMFIPCCNSCGMYCPRGRRTPQACTAIDGASFFDAERCDHVTRPPAGDDEHDVNGGRDDSQDVLGLWGNDPVADRTKCEGVIQIDPDSKYVCDDATEEINPDHSGDISWPPGVPCEDQTGSTGDVDCATVVALYGCNFDVPPASPGSEDATGVPGDPDFSGLIADDLCPRSCGRCPSEFERTTPKCQDCQECYFHSDSGCSADSCEFCDKCPHFLSLDGAQQDDGRFTHGQPTCTFTPAGQGTCQPATAIEDPHDCIRHCAQAGAHVDPRHPGFGLAFCASGYDAITGCQCDETPQGRCSLGAVNGVPNIDRENGPIEIQDEGCDILPGH